MLFVRVLLSHFQSNSLSSVVVIPLPSAKNNTSILHEFSKLFSSKIASSEDRNSERCHSSLMNLCTDASHCYSTSAFQICFSYTHTENCRVRCSMAIFPRPPVVKWESACVVGSKKANGQQVSSITQWVIVFTLLEVREVFMETPTSFYCSPLSRHINLCAWGVWSLETNRTSELNKNLYRSKEWCTLASLDTLNSLRQMSLLIMIEYMQKRLLANRAEVHVYTSVVFLGIKH